jgi:hypothetical protein
MKSYILFLLIGTLFLFSCEKEKEVYPKVETLEAIPTSAFSCTLKGSIINKGTYPVLDYGFIYASHSSVNLQSGTKISLGTAVAASTFEKEVTDLSVSPYERVLYVRAYLTNEKGTVYGSVLSFTLPSVTVQAVIPTVGKVGDRVTITGKNFLATINSLEVKFHTTSAKIIEATSDKLVVEVPATVNNYSSYYNEIPIYLSMGGQTFTALSNFRLIPTINDFSPKTGTFGTEVTITGENFPVGSYYSGLAITVGGHPVSVLNLTSTSMTVSIPTYVTSERLKIIVTASGQTTELPGEFTIESPNITAISPSTGLTGSSVTISGSNFNFSSYYYNLNKVMFGSAEANITSASATSIRVMVPSNLTPGAYPLSVFTGVHTVTAIENFVVIAPEISSFTPNIGTAGTEVIINGTFHPYSYNYNTTVKFGSVTAYVTQVTSTSIKAIVPANIPAGKTKITVTSGNQTVTAADEFEIPRVNLNSFTPASATPGTRITLFGSSFSLDKQFNVVKFGTYETTVVEASSTSLIVLVPSGVNFGAMKISVQVHGQIATSTEDFIVVNQ